MLARTRSLTCVCMCMCARAYTFVVVPVSTCLHKPLPSIYPNPSAHNSPKGIDNPAHNTTDNQTGEYSEIPSSHFLPSVPPTESDYTDIDGVTSERSDVNPYNEAENGAPANSGYSADDYNHLDHRGAGAMTAAMKKKEERTEGGSGQPKKDPYSLAKPVVAHDYTKVSGCVFRLCHRQWSFWFCASFRRRCYQSHRR